MEPALYHSVPDYRGDSLELSRKAATTDADVIVFCGVEFMAETAKILSPEKTVLVPSNRAGCSLAEAITGEDVRLLKEAYPGVPVVTYVNSYADVKAETDICCTSSNAAKVVQSLATDSVIFIPDEYLARNVARECNKTVLLPQKVDGKLEVTEVRKGGAGTLVTWPGRCEVHEKFSVQDVIDARRQIPGVRILAHPECRAEVVEAADFSGSTSAMIKYVQSQAGAPYLLLTECSMGDNIIAENPDREVVRLCSHRCPYMAQITLTMTRDALLKNQYVVTIDDDIRRRAKRSLERMLEIG
jgi:quinolinate synthase